MRLVVIAAGIATLFSLIGTPILIKLLARRNYAQAIRVSTATEAYPEHSGKKGTPSMGGVAIILAVVAGYFGAHLLAWRPLTASGLLVVYLMVGLGLVGLADDYLKVFKQRSTGLRARTKLIGQAIVALSFAWMSIHFADDMGQTPASQAISFVRDTAIVLPAGLFLLWVWFLIGMSTYWLKRAYYGINPPNPVATNFTNYLQRSWAPLLIRSLIDSLAFWLLFTPGVADKALDAVGWSNYAWAVMMITQFAPVAAMFGFVVDSVVDFAVTKIPFGKDVLPQMPGPIIVSSENVTKAGISAPTV